MGCEERLLIAGAHLYNTEATHPHWVARSREPNFPANWRRCSTDFSDEAFLLTLAKWV